MSISVQMILFIKHVDLYIIWINDDNDSSIMTYMWQWRDDQGGMIFQMMTNDDVDDVRRMT